MEIKQVATAGDFCYQPKWENGPQTEFIVPSGTFTNKETGTITLPTGLPAGTTVIMNSGADHVELRMHFPNDRVVTVKELRNTGDGLVEKLAKKNQPGKNYLHLRKGWKR